MSAPLITALVSGILLLGCIVLFRYERAHNVRFVHGVREHLDQLAAAVKERIVHRFFTVGGRSLRQSIHFIFHQILTALLRFIHRSEAWVRSIVHFNKSRAQRAELRRTDAHFTAVADHKRDAQLSEEEKRARREKALGGE